MIRYLLAAAITFLFVTTGNAQSWTVERISAPVRATEDGTNWYQLQLGDTLPASAWIQTGPRGRLILSRESERVVFRPDTLASVAMSQPSGQTMRVTQRTGSVLLSIDPASGHETEVVTPHLAAVILGTVFEVTVAGAGSALRVDEGSVSVNSGEDRAVIGAGQQANVSASGPGAITVTPADVTSLTSAIGRTFAEPFGQVRRLEVGNRGGNGGGNGIGNGGGHGAGNGGGVGHGAGNGGGVGHGAGNGGGGGHGAGNGGGNGNGAGNGGGNGSGGGNGGGNDNGAGNGGGNGNAAGNGGGNGNTAGNGGGNGT